VGPATDQWFISEGLDPLIRMTYLAVFHGHRSFYIEAALRLTVPFSGTMAYLTPRIFQVRGLFNTYKAARSAIAGGVTEIAFNDLGLAQPLFYPFYAFEGPAFLGVLGEAIVFFVVASLALFGTDI